MVCYIIICYMVCYIIIYLCCVSLSKYMYRYYNNLYVCNGQLFTVTVYILTALKFLLITMYMQIQQFFISKKDQLREYVQYSLGAACKTQKCSPHNVSLLIIYVQDVLNHNPSDATLAQVGKLKNPRWRPIWLTKL